TPWSGTKSASTDHSTLVSTLNPSRRRITRAKEYFTRHSRATISDLTTSQRVCLRRSNAHTACSVRLVRPRSSCSTPYDRCVCSTSAIVTGPPSQAETPRSPRAIAPGPESGRVPSDGPIQGSTASCPHRRSCRLHGLLPCGAPRVTLFLSIPSLACASIEPSSRRSLTQLHTATAILCCSESTR